MKNTVRIVSGRYRGQILDVPASAHAMGAREKLALFNMVPVAGLKVLDVFAGSGALGIEALSRGAEVVTFVEKNVQAVKTIKQNLNKIFNDDYNNYAKVITADAGKFNDGEKYDVILADPPYDRFRVGELRGLGALLKSSGVLVLSHSDREEVELPGLIKTDSRKYAAARITLFSKL